MPPWRTRWTATTSPSKVATTVTTKERVEQIAKATAAEHIARLVGCAADARLAKTVVPCACLGVAQDLVGPRNLFEFRLCHGIVWVCVGM